MNTETQAFNSNESGAYTRGGGGWISEVYDLQGGFRPPPLPEKKKKVKDPWKNYCKRP